MSALFWFAFGAFVGFDIALSYVRWNERSTKRGRELRWRIAGYTRQPW